MAGSNALVTVGGLVTRFAKNDERGVTLRCSKAVTLRLSPTYRKSLKQLPEGRILSAVWIAKGDDGRKNAIVASLSNGNHAKECE